MNKPEEKENQLEASIFTPEAIEKRFEEVRISNIFCSRSVSFPYPNDDPYYLVDGRTWGPNDQELQRAHAYNYKPIYDKKLRIGEERIVKNIGISKINPETLQKCSLEMIEYEICPTNGCEEGVIGKKYLVRINPGEYLSKTGKPEEFSAEKQRKVAKILGIKIKPLV